MNRKKCLIYGNCQAVPIAKLLSANIAFKAKYKLIGIKQVFLLRTEPDVKELLALVAEADLFIYQTVSDNYRNTPQLSTRYLQSILKPSCKTISFPSLFFKGYSPEIFYVKRPGIGFYQGPNNTNYHDLNIFQSYIEGLSHEKTVRILQDADLYKPIDTINSFDHSLNELVKREKDLDVKASHFIQENYRKTRLFHVINHPTYPMLNHIANEILQRAGIPKYLSGKPLIRNREQLLSSTRFPIHPSVYSNLNLNFDNEADYRLTNKHFDLAEAVHLYFSHYKEDLDVFNACKDKVVERQVV